MTVRARILAALVLSLLALLLAAPLAWAESCPKTSLPAIQEEVMCLICGVPLVNAGGPQAEDQRDFIRARVDQCESKAQIKAALVDEYGPRVLAVPSKSGFDLAAYLVPIIVLGLALGAIIFGAIGWRRSREVDAAQQELSDRPAEADSRLDDDIEKYDL